MLLRKALVTLTLAGVLAPSRGAEQRLAIPHLPSTSAPDTSWRTPEAERAALHVPPGFEVQLVASEPDIDKPMNLAFDARGRLWVTHSREYPSAAARGAGRDRVSILEDTNGDGRADRFTTFADSLNIPIGIAPMRDGAIVYSIPNLYRMFD